MNKYINRTIIIILSILIILLGAFLVIFPSRLMIPVLLKPSDPNSWDDLGKIIMLPGLLGALVSGSLFFTSGIFSILFLKNTNKTSRYHFPIIVDIIAIIISIAITIFLELDPFDLYKSYVNGLIDYFRKQHHQIVIFITITPPFLIHLLALYKEKNNYTLWALIKKLKYYIIVVALIVTIIIANIFINKAQQSSIKTIEITNNNTYYYSDFMKELKNRNLINETDDDKTQLASFQTISAYDSTTPYGFKFSSGSYHDGYYLSTDSKRKFPCFVYESYTSLIKKHPSTAKYYSIGPEDWFINWNIYFINGKIYAAFDEESEYGSMWSTSPKGTKFATVISEEDTMTIYNAQFNYYVEGGGILDTASGDQRISLPTVSDTYNDKCMKIRKVNNINSETLDKIAKELSPRLWKNK